ncbi:hypothetical protein ACP70R_014330 [Stipagrostis hirtigluma subsp. patula]
MGADVRAPRDAGDTRAVRPPQRAPEHGPVPADAREDVVALVTAAHPRDTVVPLVPRILAAAHPRDAVAPLVPRILAVVPCLLLLLCDEEAVEQAVDAGRTLISNK